MTADPFDLAVVGAGRMGAQHLAALRTSATVQVSHVVDPDPLVREQLGRAGYRAVASLEELLDQRRPDGVLIAAPTPQHGLLIRAAAAAGVPVLCEKPAGGTAAEIEAIGEFLTRHLVPVRVGFWRRHVPNLVGLRERVRSGALGAIYLVTCSQWDAVPPGAAFRATSGGILLDMAVHEIDQLRWLLDDEVARVQVTAAAHVEDPDVVGDVDAAVLTLAMAGGAIGMARVGRYFPDGDVVEAEVLGSRGAARIEVIGPNLPIDHFSSVLRRQAEAFATGVRSGQVPGAELSDAAAAARVVEEAWVSCLAPASRSGA